MTRRVYIEGMVQGVGMRPFIALVAKEFGITGTVKNIGSNVEIIATADESTLDAFIGAILARKPEMAEIVHISSGEIPPVAQKRHPPFIKGGAQVLSSVPEFSIVESSEGTVAMLPADFPVCSDCLNELQNKTNRRFRHPFISCAVCGPRYSILMSAPYDRDTTSMVDFPMCPQCAREYADPANRRYHAQTISCHECGPYLIYEDNGGSCTREEALAKAITRLKDGGIVAIKGVGGYHLACSPHNEQAVRRLRALKGRELKPFAIMFTDMAAVEKRCVIDENERELLHSPARPIVLLKTLGKPFAPSVCGDALLTGAFLPYTPLHVLLLEQCDELVMTSANLSGRPEIHEDAEMLGMLSREELSGVLYNRRRIVTRLDDSVARITAGQRQLIRRSRGYTPKPVPSPPSPHNIIAYGSDLKSAFCLLRGVDAYMSQYFGDMEELEVQQAYEKNLKHMQGLFSFIPELAVCDLHPGYHSSRMAEACGLPLLKVQHHHAHIASVMAEKGISGPVIGVAFDGTGYGADGAVWGGEFLVCGGGEFIRRAHLDYVKLAGGDSVAVDARKAALCYYVAAGIGHDDFEGAALLRAALFNDVNTVQYSGMGRLFDAVSSLLGLCHTNGYEGQCAVALENAAHRANGSGITAQNMDFEITETDDNIVISVRPVIAAIARAARADADKEAASLGFHEAVCRMVLGICSRIRGRDGVNTVALSGGTFQNGLVLSGTMKLLGDAGFMVYTNNEVPVNDGGLTLGQAYIAQMRSSLSIGMEV